MLALFLCFSETAASFAQGVSENETVPSFVSEDYEAEEPAETTDVSGGEERYVSDILSVETPEYYLGTPQIVDGGDCILHALFSDCEEGYVKASEALGVTYKTFINDAYVANASLDQINESDEVEIEFYFSGDLYLQPINVHSIFEAPLLSLEDLIYFSSATVGEVRSIHLEAGTYKLNVGCWEWEDKGVFNLYGASGKELVGALIEQWNSPLFYVSEDGIYYLYVAGANDYVPETVSVEKDDPEMIKIKNIPDENVFHYGFGEPDFTGLSVVIQYEYNIDSNPLLYGTDEFDRHIVSLGFFDASTNKPAERDEEGDLVPGKYYWKFQTRDEYPVTNQVPFTIASGMSATFVPDKVLTMGSELTVKEKDLPCYIGVDLVKGETYHFELNMEKGSAEISAPNGNTVGFLELQGGTNFTAPMTGSYIISLTEAFGKISVERGVEIKNVKVLTAPYENQIIAGANNYFAYDTSGVSVLLEFADGSKIVTDPSDKNWKKYGLSLSYLYDETGGSVFNSDGSVNLLANTDYYLHLSVACYSGEIEGADKLTVRAIPKYDLGLEEGKKFYLPTDEEGHLIGVRNYYIPLENGKYYRLYVGADEYSEDFSAYIFHRDMDSNRDYYGDDYTVLGDTFEWYFSFSKLYGKVLPENPYIMFKEVSTVSSVSIKTPSKDTFKYGVVEPTPTDVVIHVEYADGRNADISYKDFDEYGISWEVQSKEGFYAARDKNGNYAKGEYRFDFAIPGCDFSTEGYSECECAFKIVACNTDYKVNFVSNYKTGKDDSYASQTIKTNKTVALKANTFSDTGYTLVGWAAERDGAVVYKDKEKVTNIAGEDPSITLYGVWEKTAYTITYHMAGGKFKDDYVAPISYYFDSADIKLPTMSNFESREGYYFSTWYMDPSYKVNAPFTIETGTTGNLDLYALWYPESYFIMFDGNEATSGNMEDQELYYGAPEALSKNKFKKTGFVFDGWRDDYGNVYSDKDIIDYRTYESESVINDEIVLHAVWKNTFTIKFYEGSTYIGSQDYTYGKESDFSVAFASKLGYEDSAEWYREDGVTKVKKITKTTSGDFSLYLHRKPVKYTVKFNANGGKGKMKDVTAVYDVALSLPENTFTKKGYTFVGWELNENSVSDTLKLDKLNWDPSKKTVTLKAVWSQDRYRVFVVTNCDSKVNPIPLYTYQGDKTYSFILPGAPGRDGYKFEGWYSDPGFKNEVKNTKGLCGNITLYAKWSKPYTVHYDANASDATGKMDDQTLTLNKTEALKANTFKRNGYVFVGWADSPLNSVRYFDKQKISGTDGKDEITLYAVWKKYFTVSYVLNGGSFLNEKLTGYTYGVGSGYLPTAVKSGYKFAGWYSDPKFKKKVTKISESALGNMILYAKWAGLKYSVEFNANAPGGTKFTGSTKKMKGLTYGTGKAATKNGFKVKGYTFKGWALTPDGEVVIKNGEKLTAENLGYYRSTVTLYAVWDLNIYVVKYVMGGVVEDFEEYYDEYHGYYLQEPSRVGYTFLGFYTDKKFKKKAPAYKSGTKGNKTFYAKWKLNKAIYD